MTVRDLMPGSFGSYATRCLGPFAGFVTGWTFMFGMTVAGGGHTGVDNLWINGGGEAAPKELGGLMASLAVVVFAFRGIEMVGITAGETHDPKRAIPPRDQRRPRAQLFTALGAPAAASILNMVVIVAAVPAIHADTFGAGRMWFGLAEGGHAPAAFAKVSKRGVPWAAVAVMCGAPGRRRDLERRRARGRLRRGCVIGDLRDRVSLADDPLIACEDALRDPSWRPGRVRVPSAAVTGRLMARGGVHRAGDRSPRRVALVAYGAGRQCGVLGVLGGCYRLRRPTR
jgi:amino acid transporter